MAQFILVYTHPSEGEQRFDLAPGRSYRIGSRPDNDIVIDQKDVSRRHAVLRVQDGTFHITDLDSKNGTFINGAKTVSEVFTCGDMVHLSSARLVIVEVGTGSYPTSPDVLAPQDDDSTAGGREDTQKFRSEASMEDVVTLLETTARAVGRGALAEPLRWAVDQLGFDGAVVLYRDESDNVAMISSAGDLGQLARKSGVLTKLVADHRLTSAAGTRVRQVSEMGESLLLATVGSDHVLVVRYSGQPPAIGDLRSVIASVNAVLNSGRVHRQDAVTSTFAVAGSPAGAGDGLARVLGLSQSMLACKTAAFDAARHSEPVVLIGERGCGSSMLARAIHDLAVGSAAPFVVVDLEGLDPEDAGDRLLVGDDAAATIRRAAGGTLVLDRAVGVSADSWQALLAKLGDKGGGDARLTLVLNVGDDHEPGPDPIPEGCTIRLPSLRERREDVPILVAAFAAESVEPAGGRAVAFSPEALELLARHQWPGNVAELRAEIDRALAAAHPDRTVEAEHLSDEIRGASETDAASGLDLDALAGLELAEARNAFEEWLIRRTLAATNGNQTDAADRLGLSRAGLFKKMRKLGL